MNQNYNQTAALLLGASIQKNFPHSKILETGAENHCFYCEFQDSDLFQESYISLVEKTMKEFSKIEMIQREMIAPNAIQFFQYHKSPDLIARLQGIKGSINLVQIEKYYDIANYECGKRPYFFLTDFEQHDNRIYIEGTAFSSERELKSFIKKFRGYSKNNHLYLAKELELYDEESWHSRGMKLQNLLLSFWRKILEGADFGEVKTEDPILYFNHTGTEKFHFFDGIEDQIYSFQEKNVISLLQLMQSWVKIFDFDCKWILLGSKQKKKTTLLEHSLREAQIEFIKDGVVLNEAPGIELHVSDALGRFWVCSKLEVLERGTRFQLLGNLERFISLLLEKYEGNLPYWLAPEQIRLITFKDVDTKPIEEILKLHAVRYKIENSSLLLKEKIYQALHLKVPYVMVFGKKEESAEQITVRTCGSSRDQTMTIRELNQFLLERKFESQ